MMTKLCFLALLLCIATFLTAADVPSIRGGNGIVLPPPPPTEAEPVTETIHGVTVTDPYRWLEDSQSPATRSWLEAQMKYTQDYLGQVKIRPEVTKRLADLVRVETYGIPVEREDRFFFKKRLSEENQGSIYVRNGLSGNFRSHLLPRWVCCRAPRGFGLRADRKAIPKSASHCCNSR